MAGSIPSVSPRRARKRPRRGAGDRKLSSLLKSDGAGANLLTTLALARAAEIVNPIGTVIPPDTVLNAAFEAVRDYTHFPVETALAALLAVLSGALAQAGSTVTWPGISKPSECALWIVLLAPSASGKTFVRDVFRDSLAIQLNLLPEPGSARMFLDGMAAMPGHRAIWDRDEWGQLMAKIRDGGPLGDLRDLLLRTYDHGRIETNTKKDGQTLVEHPVLTIFGGSVSATWSSCVDVHMLSDGLLARFLFVVAARRPREVAIIERDEMLAHIRAKAMQSLVGRLGERVEYHISAEAKAFYITEWKRVSNLVGTTIDDAYFQRVTWATSRFAVIYHLLLDKAGSMIDVDAMQWAWRLTQLFLHYARAAIDLSDSGFAGRVEKMLAWVEQQRQKPGPGGGKWTREALARALMQQFRRDIGSVREALHVVDLARKS